MGCIGMSFDDFCRLTPTEFGHVMKAYQESRDAGFRAGWERTRMLAAITIQPHCKKKILPKDLLTFPWEKAKMPKHNRPATTKAEDKRRFEKLAGKG